MITLPEAFEQEMKQLLGEEEYEAYRKTFDEAVHRGLRVNNGKISTEEFLRRTDIPLKKVPWIPNGFYYVVMVWKDTSQIFVQTLSRK